MNATISTAVARGWISFPAPTKPVAKRVLADAAQVDARRAWQLWDQGASLTYVARAVGVRRSIIRSVIQEGRP